jgi:hypothetical protein
VHLDPEAKSVRSILMAIASFGRSDQTGETAPAPMRAGAE